MVEWGQARCLRAATVLVAVGAMLVFGAGSVSAGTGLTTIRVPQAVCPPATALTWSCEAVRLATERVPRAEVRQLRAAGVAASPAAFGNGPKGGYAPQDLAAAYGVNPATATTQTVGIVDAFNDPTVLSDLNTFDTQYGLPSETPSSFEVVNQTGGADLSGVPDDVGWAGEITLDVQTVRGLCHSCKIILVEASSTSSSNLGQAVNEAVALGATIVSNSYGGPEFAGDPFQAADYTHPGVAILASSGDSGWYGWDNALVSMSNGAPNVPASYPTVVGVGGTTLDMNPGATARTGEFVWNDDGNEGAAALGAGFLLGGTGGGCSTVWNAPPWELNVANYASLGCGSGLRSGVDIAADADENTGYDVYETTTSWCLPGMHDPNNNACPNSDPLWQTYGGTSLASPLVASIWALAGGRRGSPTRR